MVAASAEDPSVVRTVDMRGWESEDREDHAACCELGQRAQFCSPTAELAGHRGKARRRTLKRQRRLHNADLIERATMEVEEALAPAPGGAAHHRRAI